jgi:hypothetical protein
MSAPKILITTPVYGAPDSASVSVAYHEALLSMAQSGQIQLTPHMQWIGEDLVRVRCRALRFFLAETDCTHLLFWDADVGGSDPTGERACCALALMGMIAEDVDVICAPYPRKRILWNQIRGARRRPRVFLAAASTGSRRTGRIRRPQGACRWRALRVRADQARGCGQGRVRVLRERRDVYRLVRGQNSNYGACFPAARDD